MVRSILIFLIIRVESRVLVFAWSDLLQTVVSPCLFSIRMCIVLLVVKCCGDTQIYLTSYSPSYSPIAGHGCLY